MEIKKNFAEGVKKATRIALSFLVVASLAFVNIFKAEAAPVPPSTPVPGQCQPAPLPDSYPLPNIPYCHPQDKPIPLGHPI